MTGFLHIISRFALIAMVLVVTTLVGFAVSMRWDEWHRTPSLPAPADAEVTATVIVAGRESAAEYCGKLLDIRAVDPPCNRAKAAPNSGLARSITIPLPAPPETQQ